MKRVKSTSWNNTTAKGRSPSLFYFKNVPSPAKWSASSMVLHFCFKSVPSPAKPSSVPRVSPAQPSGVRPRLLSKYPARQGQTKTALTAPSPAGSEQDCLSTTSPVGADLGIPISFQAKFTSFLARFTFTRQCCCGILYLMNE